jgi:hypothetical protein
MKAAGNMNAIQLLPECIYSLDYKFLIEYTVNLKSGISSEGHGANGSTVFESIPSPTQRPAGS